MAETKVSLDTNEGSESSLSSIKAIPVTSDPIDIGIITDGSIGGVGIFDVLMRAVDAHIESQWDNDRINGQEYATVYSEAIVATLDRAVNLAVQQLRLGFEIENLRKEGAYKDAQIELAKQQLEKQPYEIKLLEAQTEQVKAQTTNVGATTDRITKETEQKLPAEVKMLTAQVTGIEAENELTGTKVLISKEELKQYPVQLEILGKQKDQLTAQIEGINLGNDKATYELANKLPLETELLTLQGEGLAAETTLTNVKIQATTEELAKIPLEVELLTKQSLQLDQATSLVSKQVEQLSAEITKIPHEITILEKQASQLTTQIANTQATTDRMILETEQKLPIEVANLAKQGLSIDAQTKLTENQVEISKLQATVIPVEIEYKQAQIANMGKQNLILEREFEIKLGELALQEKQLELAVISLDLQREELKVKQAQVEGQKAQSELYNQKVITEKAQTDATVIGKGSVIDLNNQVLDGQVGAYEFDKINRASKLVLDVFATTYAEGDRTVNNTNLLRDDELGKLMKVMYTNVGVST